MVIWFGPACTDLTGLGFVAIPVKDADMSILQVFLRLQTCVAVIKAMWNSSIRYGTRSPYKVALIYLCTDIILHHPSGVCMLYIRENCRRLSTNLICILPNINHNVIIYRWNSTIVLYYHSSNSRELIFKIS